MPDDKKHSTFKIALATGLFCGLGATIIVPQFTKALDTSQSLTILVILVGFVLGFGGTYLFGRPSAPPASK